MLPSAECLYLFALFLCIMSGPVMHSRKHLQKLCAEFSRHLPIQTSEMMIMMMMMIRNSCSYFDFSWHLCCIIFFSDIVFNARRLPRYLGISFLCWIRLLNLGLILWLDTACWRYEYEGGTVILRIPRTRIRCFQLCPVVRAVLLCIAYLRF